MWHLIFCDESRQTGHRYMAIGGIVVTSGLRQDFLSEMQRLRSELRMRDELKWTKVSNQKFSEYCAFVDFFFRLLSNRQAHFHALLVDRHKFRNAAFHQGDRELGFYKMYYQLLLHRFGRRYGQMPDARLLVYPDRRNSSYPLRELVGILNNGLSKRYGIATRPFKGISPLDSKKSEVLQINDIILGAVSFHRNDSGLIPGTRQSKIDLSDYIAKKAGLPNLSACTPQSGPFTIWNIQLQ